MADSYVVAIEGLDSLNSLSEISDSIVKAARLAVNATAKRSQVAASKSMRSQVAFPARYLTGKTSRLNITKMATTADLEAVITGRARATSLARFVTGNVRVGGGNASAKGVSIEVKPGLARRMTGAFLMKLRAGSGDGEPTNVGLALRTKDGKKPNKAYKPVPLGKNLWLLYGPSVSQVFDKTRGMVQPDMELFMEREFNRIVELDL